MSDDKTVNEMVAMNLHELIEYAERNNDTDCEYVCAQRMAEMSDLLLGCIMQLTDYSSNEWIMVEGMSDLHINDVEMFLGLDELTPSDEYPDKARLQAYKDKHLG